MLSNDNSSNDNSSNNNSSKKSKRKKIRKRDLFAAPGKKLNDAALRALREAAERRRKFDAAFERSGEDGESRLEPTRYGDWEAQGKCSDF